MVRANPYAQVVIPAHPHIVTGILATILDGAGLTLEQFLALL